MGIDAEEYYRIKDKKTIEIITMKGEPEYSGRTGVVEFIDDIGQLHGSWGGCAVIPEEDDFRIIDDDESL